MEQAPAHDPAIAPADGAERQPVHPFGPRARTLLCSVFGPYARDDQYGSRRINPMELYHNQVTRVQGPFSLRMFHRSWGLMLIQANLDSPCTLLDFPTLDRFERELATERYDVIGISGILPNLEKVRVMCQRIRAMQPGAVIVVGGHIANLPGLKERIDADHVVRGEGVAWFRHYLGQRVDQPIRHPRIISGFGTRTMGITLPGKPGDAAAALIPSVGCPVGCNFCSTSAMFGGKGKFIDFYKTGDELFAVMLDLEKALKIRSFFVMDENFLLHRKRALRLLELMREHGKAWALYVFSSANVIRSYTLEQLVGLGISWVWMGLEGKQSQYAKLSGADTMELVRTLRSHGIRVLGSSIIGLEEHTPDNIDAAIDYSVAHDTEFHQFMLYSPIPGTPLWEQFRTEGRLTDPDNLHLADTHGQLRFNYRHPHLTPGSETEILLRAFTRDFEVNGPSVVRMTRTLLAGARRYRHHPDRRIRARVRWETKALPTTLAGAVWASRAWFAARPGHERLVARIDDLLRDLYRQYPITARLAAPIAGRYILRALRAEDRRLRQGWTYEPPTFYERTHQRPGLPGPDAVQPSATLVDAPAGIAPC